MGTARVAERAGRVGGLHGRPRSLPDGPGAFTNEKDRLVCVRGRFTDGREASPTAFLAENAGS